MGALRTATRDLAGAVTFLTVLPVGRAAAGGDLARGSVVFSLVGAGVGAAAGGIWIVAADAFGTGVAAVLATLVLVGLTGALHLDGLADCADALGVRGGRERRLAVMREPSIGTFGVAAAAGWLLLEASVLAATPRDRVVWALALCGALSRFTAVQQAGLLAPARTDGLGAGFAPARVAVLACGIVAAAVGIAGVGPADTLAAVLAAQATALGVGAAARHGLGGRTGDTLGASVALTEVVSLLVLLGVAR